MRTSLARAVLTAPRRLVSTEAGNYTEAEQLTKKVASYLPRFTTATLSREDEVVLYTLPEHMDKVTLFLRDSAITQMKAVADASTTPVAPPK
ncbi:hypothetical protein KFE25_008535 [Diacronema lutheri]|uniref:Uncharacterized protein n=1 Tax=Diacronema lutheri TaxID=2081491 RepID=A0A8J5XTA3_DIALT|nr:hypothetical protein KFE25_008535 [Diacronema lutheri]